MTILSQSGIPSPIQTLLGAAFQTINMTARHEGAAGAATTFAQQGTVASTPTANTAGFNQPFPGPKAGALRARAWTNNLAQAVTVTLMVNRNDGQGLVVALDSQGVAMTVVIPAGSILPVLNSAQVITFNPTDIFEVRLTSTAAGAGNVALIGVALESLN